MRAKLYDEAFSGIYFLSYVCLNQDSQDEEDSQDESICLNQDSPDIKMLGIIKMNTINHLSIKFNPNPHF